MRKINWDTLGVFEERSISSSFSLFMNTILYNYQKCFPIETIKLRYKNRNPWITQELKNDIKIRDHLYIIQKKNPIPENIINYKQYKNKNLTKQRKAEREYYHEQFEIHQHDLKKSWKVIKNIIGKEDNHTIKKQTVFLINNQYTTDSQTIANAFNNYFINVGSSLAKNLNSDTDPMLYVQYFDKSIDIPEINTAEIISVISSLSNSAAGYDEIPASIMKQLIVYYVQPLTLLINKSIAQGKFPDELKLAKVLPIYKNEDEQMIQNYRPISVLPFFSKIFEKIISIYITDFIEENGLFYSNQFGFRKSHGTSHAIISLVEKVSKALDTGKFVIGVFLDLRKAFDTVNHDILIKKLESYGIRGNILNWLKSYLSNRTQYVHYNDYDSDKKTVTHGVPQGSILGPLLFILYINDFSRSSDLLFSILFADDTSVFIEGTNYDKVIDIVNKELELINIWLIANKLTVNIKKTHYMMFHRTRIKYNIRDITINGKNVAYTKNTKFLGVIIDNKLTWSDHIIYIKNKISKSIGIIHKTRNFLTKNTLRNLYYTFVYPYLIYCVEIWGNTNDIHLDPLIKIQKKGIRAITFSHHLDSTAPLFHNLNILNFKKLVTQRIALLMFKYHIGSLPVPISNLFSINSNRHNYYTRQINDLQLNTGRGENVYKLFSFHGVRIWNHISKKIQTDVSYACFKNLSKTYLQNNEIPQRIR